MIMFSIRDQKSDGYNRPFFSATRATAMREVSLGLRDDSPMSVYAQDFKLFEIGEFDPHTGIVTCEPIHPYHVCDVGELIEVPDGEADTSTRLG